MKLNTVMYAYFGVNVSSAVVFAIVVRMPRILPYVVDRLRVSALASDKVV